MLTLGIILGDFCPQANEPSPFPRAGHGRLSHHPLALRPNTGHCDHRKSKGHLLSPTIYCADQRAARISGTALPPRFAYDSPTSVDLGIADSSLRLDRREQRLHSIGFVLRQLDDLGGTSVLL